ncbi:TMF-regulated nuclear protein 1-like [Hirundo rustica]|uniref:TMF-regulated nuclear protein 1-like n=1 Tax=Hirundo rustica TaxID=43150 RepID=UPI001A947C74|nr:TMF-regulated nuclear protein 1-like [Hirundo rustica]
MAPRSRRLPPPAFRLPPRLCPPPRPGTASGTGTGTASGTGTAAGSGSAAGTASGTGTESGSGTAAGTASGTGTESGSGTAAGAGAPGEQRPHRCVTWRVIGWGRREERGEKRRRDAVLPCTASRAAPCAQGQRCSAESPGATEGPCGAPGSLVEQRVRRLLGGRCRAGRRCWCGRRRCAGALLARPCWKLGRPGLGGVPEPPCPVHRWSPRAAFSPPGSRCLLSDGHSGGLGTVTQRCIAHLTSALCFFHYFLRCELSSVGCHLPLSYFLPLAQSFWGFVMKIIRLRS